MIHTSLLSPMRKVFRFYAGFALAILLLQVAGIIVYSIQIWPGVRDSLSSGVTILVCLGGLLVLVRSCLWIWIYHAGARVFSVLHLERDSTELANHLGPTLMTLARLLVISCILDGFFVPVIFLIDVLLPLSGAGWWLGAIYLSILFLPQAFGIGALILAFLTYQFAQLLKERSELKEEIELTI